MQVKAGSEAAAADKASAAGASPPQQRHSGALDGVYATDWRLTL